MINQMMLRLTRIRITETRNADLKHPRYGRRG
jgi:hypothetical protein